MADTTPKILQPVERAAIRAGAALRGQNVNGPDWKAFMAGNGPRPADVAKAAPAATPTRKAAPAATPTPKAAPAATPDVGTEVVSAVESILDGSPSAVVEEIESFLVTLANSVNPALGTVLSLLIKVGNPKLLAALPALETYAQSAIETGISKAETVLSDVIGELRSKL